MNYTKYIAIFVLLASSATGSDFTDAASTSTAVASSSVALSRAVVQPEILDDKVEVSTLDVLLEGTDVLDIEDWKKNTEYVGYNKDSPQIRWFWDFVSNLSDAERRQILRLATGSTGVPGSRCGDSKRKFGIHKAYNTNFWPIGHTCFNYFDLPEYSSRELLESRMSDAISDVSMSVEMP